MIVNTELTKEINKYNLELTEYDVDADKLAKRLDRENPLINEKDFIEKTEQIASENKSLAKLSLSDYVNGNEVSNIKALRKFLSICLDRESIIEVILDVHNYDELTRTIAMTNPLCPYKLLLKVEENEFENYAKSETFIAKRVRQSRESEKTNNEQ